MEWKHYINEIKCVVVVVVVVVTVVADG